MVDIHVPVVLHCVDVYEYFMDLPPVLSMLSWRAVCVLVLVGGGRG